MSDTNFTCKPWVLSQLWKANIHLLNSPLTVGIVHVHVCATECLFPTPQRAHAFINQAGMSMKNFVATEGQICGQFVHFVVGTLHRLLQIVFLQNMKLDNHGRKVFFIELLNTWPLGTSIDLRLIFWNRSSKVIYSNVVVKSIVLYIVHKSKEQCR